MPLVDWDQVSRRTAFQYGANIRKKI